MNYDIFADEKKKEEIVIEIKSKKLLDLPLEGTSTLTSREDEKKDDDDESPAEEAAETTSEEVEEKDVIEVEKDFPKKDIGVGGASFIDEFLRVATDDQMAMLKRGERTLAGFWNWAYSKVKAEYVKECGRVNGGVFRDVGSLASEYFSDAVKEGTVIECDEYRVKAPTPPKCEVKKETKKTTKRKSAKKAIVEVAKKAVDDAKRENEEKKAKIMERIESLEAEMKEAEVDKTEKTEDRPFVSIFRSRR